MNFSNKNIYLHIKDYSVSNENFDLLIDTDLQLLKTYPQPKLENLNKYYESQNYISHTDSNRTLFEKIYQIVKKFSIKQKVKLISKYQPQKGVLFDIGAGTGDFLVAAKSKNWQTKGFEPNKNAKNLAISKGITFSESIESVENQSVNVVTMWHVLEHVPDINYQMKQIKRILKPNGILIVAVPNYQSFDANYYKQFWAGFDVPRHLWHFSKKSIEIIVSHENMKLIKIKPMLFDSFYVSLLSEKYKTGKMNFFKAFYIGFISNCKGLFSKEFSSHIYIIKNN